MNNDQIDNTDYYRLPCGKYLEDFIYAKKMNFAWGSALKYWWRAGRKDGENVEKDLAKHEHYVRFIAREMFHGPSGGKLEQKMFEARVHNIVVKFADEAREWRG